MKLFEPNNLSQRRAEFLPVNDQALTHEVHFLLENYYALPSLSNIKISAFAGANISAQNFKIETTASKYFLKSRDQTMKPKMRSEAELTAALQALGQRVPSIVRSRHDHLVSLYPKKCWVLYEFQDGDYFSGRGNELQAAADAFVELSRAATSLFLTSRTQVDALPGDLRNLLDRAATHPALAALCNIHRPTILESLCQIEERQQLLNSRRLPLHLDYHPLNLLMNSGDVACIVDLEHLKPYSAISGLGFAAYKLIRQAMIDDEFRVAETNAPTAVSTWLESWQKAFPEDRFTQIELGVGARARILKLIELILDAAINQNDDRFNYDLEKQIVSLYEADVIFGKN